MKVVFFLAVLTVAQCASLTDFKSLLGQQTYTCNPTCGAGQCCVHFMTPMHGGRRQLTPIDIQKALLLQNQHAGEIQTLCKDIPVKGGRCLVNNPGEWCDCATGLTCKPNGPSGLSHYFGTCS